MKSIFYLLFLSFFNPCRSQQINTNSLNPAAKEVYNYITAIESQFEKNGNRIFDLSSDIETLINLSEHSAKFVDGNYLGAIYEVSADDINWWKNWFGNNKDNFTYYNDDGINLELLKELHIIMVEYEPGKFRYSASEYELQKYRKLSSEVKNKKG